MSSSIAMIMRAMSTARETVRTAAGISPTETEIAALAYRLWQDNGCPIGSDREDWFRAEAMLKNVLAEMGQDLQGQPSVPLDDNGTEFEMLAEFRWEGHWVVWESEWGGARWVCDLGTSGVEVLTGV